MLESYVVCKSDIRKKKAERACKTSNFFMKEKTFLRLRGVLELQDTESTIASLIFINSLETHPLAWGFNLLTFELLFGGRTRSAGSECSVARMGLIWGRRGRR